MVDVFATSHYTKSHLHKTHESNYVDEEKTGVNNKTRGFMKEFILF